MKLHFYSLAALSIAAATPSLANELSESVKTDCDDYLWPLSDYFHRNPEL